MFSLKILRTTLALSALPLAATGQQPGISSEIVDKVVISLLKNPSSAATLNKENSSE